MNQDIDFKTWITIPFHHIGSFFKSIFSWKNKTPFWRILWAIITICILIITAVLCHAYFSHIRSQSQWVTSQPLSQYICFTKEEYGDHPGWLTNRITGKRILDNVDWVTASDDSLAVFARNDKRGYINRHTGHISIPPKYDAAWLFSQGIAAVALADSIYFINTSGSPANDKRFTRDPRLSYIFHGDYCIMNDTCGLLGLINRQGDWVVPPQYDQITPAPHNYWRMRRGDAQTGLWYAYDCHARLVDSPAPRDLDIIADLGVIYTLPNHLKMVIDFEGNRRQQFLCQDIEPLYYDSPRRDSTGAFIPEPATLSLYRMSDGYEGLCRKNGQLVTDPIYWSVRAIDKDLYHCIYKDSGCGVIIDSSGNITAR